MYVFIVIFRNVEIQINVDKYDILRIRNAKVGSSIPPSGTK